MSKRYKLVATAVLSAGLIAGSATAALAGTTPTPTPSYTPPPRPVPVNWTFDGTQLFVNRGPVLSDINVNNVEGRGALLMRGWQDVNGINPAIDTFRLGVNSVTLLHNPISQAAFQVNPYTCTVKFDQSGRFRSSTERRGRNLTSRNGQFRPQQRGELPARATTPCVARFVSAGTIIRAVQSGRRSRASIPASSVSTSRARCAVTRTPVIIRPFTPVATPTVTPTVTPTDTPTPVSS